MLLALTHHIAVVQLRTDDHLTDSHFPHFLAGQQQKTESSAFPVRTCNQKRILEHPQIWITLINCCFSQKEMPIYLQAFWKAFPLTITLKLPGFSFSKLLFPLWPRLIQAQATWIELWQWQGMTYLYSCSSKWVQLKLVIPSCNSIHVLISH